MILHDLKDSLYENISESPVLSFIFNKKHIAVASFILVLFVAIGWFISTRPKTIVTSEPGKLSSFYSVKDWGKMKRLTIIGAVDSTDLSFLHLYASSLESIDLSKTKLTSIPDSAFSNWSSLEQAVLPDTLVQIGKSAFSGCSKLSSVVLPSRVEIVGENAFFGTSLTLMTVPSSVKCIGAGAFASTKLSKIEVAADNKAYKVNNGVLFNNDSTVLIQYPALKDGNAYMVPASVKLVGTNAFAGAGKLVTVDFKSEKIAFGEGVFKNCISLDSFSCPKGMDTIPAYFFEGCVSLKKVKLPEQLRVVSDNAFWNCTSLTDVKLPNSVNKIGDFSFAYCKSLAEVDIPSVKQLGKFAFAYCVGLNTISFPKTLDVISESAFCNCEKLVKLNIPSCIQLIGDRAFAGCLSLTDVNLAEGLRGLGAMAFSSCGSLESIVLPTSLVYIYGDCFTGCSKLCSISIKANLPPDCKTDFPSSVTTNCTLYAPYSSIPRYQFEVGWNKFFRVQSLNKE